MRAMSMTLLCVATLAGCSSIASKARLPQVTMTTDAGEIVIELDTVRAPISAGNFLRYVDGRHLDGGTFYRVVHAGNDNNPAEIEVIQGGMARGEGDAKPPFPPIAHETTATTGLKHIDGTISMARGKPGTAQSEFFIVIGANPALDFGGARNADGQGFAAFGRVLRGMEVVRAIQRNPTRSDSNDAYVKGQMLATPVRIVSVRRTP